MADSDQEYKPRLRPVEAYPVEHEGQRLVLLRDGTGATEAQLVLSPEAFFVVTLLDGTRTMLDLKYEFARRSGGVLPGDELDMLLGRLDEALFMDSPRFREHMAGLERDFAALAERPARLAGRAYDTDPEELGKWLDNAVETGTENGTGDSVPRGKLLAFIAPHIDIGRGAGAYGAAWRGARESKPDRVVILGTSHFGHSDSLFIATRKPFRTPLGLSHVDSAVMDELEAAAGPGVFEGGYAHAGEHSVEFQVLFTQRFFGTGVPIVPLLACSLHGFFGSGSRPSADGRISSVCSVLAGLMTDPGSRTLFIASADLAHVGPRFGDERQADPAFLASVESTDRELLSRACALDAEGFFDAVERGGDATRVCGFPSIYAMLLALKDTGAAGTLREYDSAVDETGSAVTFAGVTFERS